MRLLFNPTIRLVIANILVDILAEISKVCTNIYMWPFIETIPSYKISLQAPESYCPLGPALECCSAKASPNKPLSPNLKNSQPNLWHPAQNTERECACLQVR